MNGPSDGVPAKLAPFFESQIGLAPNMGEKMFECAGDGGIGNSKWLKLRFEV